MRSDKYTLAKWINSIPMACLEVSKNLQRERIVDMLPRQSWGIYLMPAQRNEFKLAQLPYQIFQGLLSCFGSLKRFTTKERMCNKDITQTSTEEYDINQIESPAFSCNQIKTRAVTDILVSAYSSLICADITAIFKERKKCLD